MMTLKTAAQAFNKQKFTDASGSAYFYGQILPFPDNVRSGMASRRRILETAPTVVIPTSMVVKEFNTNQCYIVAAPAIDYYMGEAIRIKYPVLPVESKFSIRDIGQVLANSGGVSDVYASLSYVKRVVFDDASDYTGGSELFHSSAQTVAAGLIFSGSVGYFRAREKSRIDDINFGTTEVVELVSPISSATYTSKGDFNTTTDSYQTTTINNVSIFVEHVMLDFVHEALGFIPLEAGDKTISFLKSQVTYAKVGDTIGTYKIVSLNDNGTFWTTHARRSP